MTPLPTSVAPTHADADADADKRRRHANAQERYRAKNLEETRTKARLRMERYVIPSLLCQSQRLSQLAAARRRKTDADYRERCRKKKFIAKYGERAFIKHYLPLHDIFGEYIVGQKFVRSDEVPSKKRMSKLLAGPKSKAAVVATP
ncbi:hypothetical protein B0H11DRAFT_2257927 [Mycena galericulata]|nr:hypothetical protein B0H11DRAFT_2257927 [Mycena galericulata]